MNGANFDSFVHVQVTTQEWKPHHTQRPRHMQLDAYRMPLTDKSFFCDSHTTHARSAAQGKLQSYNY